MNSVNVENSYKFKQISLNLSYFNSNTFLISGTMHKTEQS